MTEPSPVYQEKSPARRNLGLAIKSIIDESKRLDSKSCKACGMQFTPRNNAMKYCDDCRIPLPGVYRFVAPDGKSFVGSTHWLKTRPVFGLKRQNFDICKVAERYPLDTWRFEVLEYLPAECSKQELREAEQRWIDRLGTLSPEFGFNVDCAAPPKGCQRQTETARDYGVSTHALKRWVKLLGFPALITVGRNHFYSIAELDEWDRQWTGLSREEISRKVWPHNMDRGSQ